ncbi:hypothetical protein BKI52_05590 [marine bacterium AO1-C]|nr:hypothetical protein BKI52_05590 [marine bacterium AO1-C]
MIYGATLIVLGILAAPSLLLSRRPDAKETLDKITPYQGWIGLVFFFWGLWGVIRTVLRISLLKYHALWWATSLAGGLLEAALGFLLGYALINKLVLSNSDEAKEKGKRLLEKLRPMQTTLGVISIGLGIWLIITRLFLY